MTRQLIVENMHEIKRTARQRDRDAYAAVENGTASPGGAEEVRVLTKQLVAENASLKQSTQCLELVNHMMTVARQSPDAWRHLKWIRSSVDLRHYVKDHLPNISCNADRIWKDDKSTGELGVQYLLADAIDREESKGEKAHHRL